MGVGAWALRRCAQRWRARGGAPFGTLSRHATALLLPFPPPRRMGHAPSSHRQGLLAHAQGATQAQAQAQAGQGARPTTWSARPKASKQASKQLALFFARMPAQPEWALVAGALWREGCKRETCLRVVVSATPGAMAALGLLLTTRRWYEMSMMSVDATKHLVAHARAPAARAARPAQRRGVRGTGRSARTHITDGAPPSGRPGIRAPRRGEQRRRRRRRHSRARRVCVLAAPWLGAPRLWRAGALRRR